MKGRKHDPRFYPVIYGANRDEDWSSPEVWKKANPSLGITVKMEKVKDAYNSAKENTFRQLRLNQWVKQDVRWMPMDKWDTCAFPVDPNELRGRDFYGGLDLSSTTDITAFVLVFPPRDDSEGYTLLPYFWIPEDNVDLRVHVIMFHMIFGNNKVICKQQKEMWFTTFLLNNLLMTSVKNTTLRNLPLTDGVR